MLKREGDRVWLDLDEFYRAPDKQPKTVFESLANAIQAMGCDSVIGETDDASQP